jgi:hypothetical protein
MDSVLELDRAVGSTEHGGDRVTKRHKPKIDNRLVQTAEVDERVVEPSPRVRSFVAPDCSACTALRKGPESYTRVYATVRGNVGITRYCKCGFCGNTFKSVELHINEPTT